MATYVARTRYLGPTDTAGARVAVTATLNGVRMTKTYPYNYASNDAHADAVTCLLHDLGHTQTRVSVESQTPTGRTFTAWASSVGMLTSL